MMDARLSPLPDPPTDIAPSGAPPPVPTTKRTLRQRLKWPIRGFAACLFLLMLAIVWLAITAPLSKSLRPIAPPSMTLLSSDGRVIARRGAIIDRPVDVTKLPKHVGDAFVAIEDRRFYGHWGVDPRGIVRAAWHNMRGGGVREGGSTITQQLAKLVFLNSDRTIGRKGREVLVAFWLEAWLTKPQILSRYLSTVYFGDNVYGLRAAARHYFDKAPGDLSVAEAAMLAGLMKAPSRLAPSTNLSGAQARQALVVRAMTDGGFISPDRAAGARPARLHLVPVSTETRSTYFADWVMPAARGRAADAYGSQTVTTTLDARLQRIAERSVTRAGRAGLQIALVSMRPDGRVVAMVGGRDYRDSSFNRVTQARRQPGSTFKLFVYLAALRAGMTPDDKVDDSPLTLGGRNGTGGWSPANAGGHYRGSITLRQAFAQSSNVAAVRLAQQVGMRSVIRAARDLGVRSPLSDDPSLALGTSGMTLLELCSAYAAVAAGSYPVTGHALPEEEKGWVASAFDWFGGPSSFSGRQHDALLDLLAATVNSGTGRAAALDAQVFGKTGTSQDNRDAIFVGFSGDLVTAVWIGRDDNKPVPGLAGGGLPARVWRNFMSEATGTAPKGAPVPVTVDPDVGNISDLGNATIGNIKLDIGIGENGINLSLSPREPQGQEPTAPSPDDPPDADTGDRPPRPPS